MPRYIVSYELYGDVQIEASSAREEEDTPMKRTTATFSKLIDGTVVLEVHELTDDNQVIVHTFDIDAYTLQLAHHLLGTLSDQAESEGVV